MRALDLLTTSGLPAESGQTDKNPLVEPHALDEAMLVAIAVDVTYAEAVLLFDCRNAIWPFAGHVALKVTGLAGLRLESMVDRTHANYINGWTPTVSPGHWKLETFLIDGGPISIDAADAALVVLGTPDFKDPSPDLAEDDDETIRRGFPSWYAQCDVMTVFRLPAS